MKQPIYILMLLAAVLLTNCHPGQNEPEQPEAQAIAFRTQRNAVASTRSATTDPQDPLGSKIYVFGTKTIGTQTETVFNACEVLHEGSSWTYTPLQNWDQAASSYAFAAYSTGLGYTQNSSTIYAQVSNASINGFTFSGTKEKLQACYFTDKKVVEPENFYQTVNLSFSQLATRVRVGFYNAMTGYTIQNLQFYASGDANATPSSNLVLYCTNNVFPTGTQGPTEGAYTIRYVGENTTVSYNGPETNTLTIGPLLIQSTSTPISTNATAATYTDYCLTLPATITQKLNLRVQFTKVDSNNQQTTETRNVAFSVKNPWLCNKQYTILVKIAPEGLIIGEEEDDDYRH